MEKFEEWLLNNRLQLTSEICKILIFSLLIAFVILHKKNYDSFSVWDQVYSNSVDWYCFLPSQARRPLTCYHEDKGDGYSFRK